MAQFQLRSIKSVLWFSFWLFCCCASVTANASSALDTPFSKKRGIVSKAESKNLSRLGKMGIMAAVSKPVVGMDIDHYRSFDTSVVLAPRSVADVIRKLIRKQLAARHMRHADHHKSQAGIATIMLSFRSKAGKISWEMILVAFDRKKAQAIVKESPGTRGLRLVLQSAIKVSVTRLYPEYAIDVKPGAEDTRSRNAINKLVKKSFAGLIQKSLQKKKP